MFSLTMPTFSSFSGTATMALGVTSAPVPAVVGMRMMGTHFLARPGSSSSFLDAVLVGDQHAGQLGRVHDAAAAAGHDHVGAADLELIDDLLHGHVAGLRGQIVQDVVLRPGGLDGGLGQVEQPSFRRPLSVNMATRFTPLALRMAVMLSMAFSPP